MSRSVQDKKALKLSLLLISINSKSINSQSRRLPVYHPESKTRATRESEWERRNKQNMNDGETVIDFINVLLFPMRNNS